MVRDCAVRCQHDSARRRLDLLFRLVLCPAAGHAYSFRPRAPLMRPWNALIRTFASHSLIATAIKIHDQRTEVIMRVRMQMAMSSEQLSLEEAGR